MRTQGSNKSIRAVEETTANSTTILGAIFLILVNAVKYGMDRWVKGTPGFDLFLNAEQGASGGAGPSTFANAAPVGAFAAGPVTAR